MSLIMRRWGGGGYKRGRGQIKFYPYKENGERVFSHTQKKRAGGGGGGGAKHYLSHAERVGGRKKFRGSFDVSH